MAAFLPGVAGAQGIAQSSDAGPFQDLLINILDFSNDVLIPFIIGIGFLFFVWGIFKFFIFGGANEEAKEQGKSLIIWATIGFVLIIVFWGVVNLLSESTGLANGELQNIPTIDVP
jgi:uncharacterized membrane protein YidH (DUF202 family)